MAADYNSRLISQLYAADDARETEEILSEMSENRDPVFIYPIFDAYKKFRDSTMSHFYLSYLQEYDSQEVLKFFKEVEADNATDPLDYTYALAGLLKYNHFSETILKRAESVLIEFSISNTNIGLDDLLAYLKAGGALNNLDEILKDIFEDEMFEAEDRRLTRGFLLGIDPKKWIGFYIENYASIEHPSTEVQLAKVISTWKGTLSEKLKDTITSQGTSRAKEVIEQARKAKEVARSEEAKKEEVPFSNGSVVAQIISERQKINLLSSTNPSIKFEIFNQDESLVKQMETATSEESLVGRMAELRSHIQNINDQVAEHGLSFEEAKNIIDGLAEVDFRKSLNQLVLLLKIKKISVGVDLCGLKPLNRAVNLFAHPDQKAELSKALEALGLGNLYKKENWPELHRAILNAYLEVSKKIVFALAEKQS